MSSNILVNIDPFSKMIQDIKKCSPTTWFLKITPPKKSVFDSVFSNKLPRSCNYELNLIKCMVRFSQLNEYEWESH